MLLIVSDLFLIFIFASRPSSAEAQDKRLQNSLLRLQNALVNFFCKNREYCFLEITVIHIPCYDLIIL